ncbi:hypothetical protein ACXYMP_05785 [Aliiroseovarius sp. CAU 1755]
MKETAIISNDPKPHILPQVGGAVREMSACQAILDALDNKPSVMKVYSNGQLMEKSNSFLPLPHEDDVAYQHRLRSIYECRTFLIYISGIDDRFAPEQFDWLRGCASRFRPKCKHYDLELFFGWYQATPGGVHSEACFNAHQVILGAKAMLLWRPDSLIPSSDEIMRIDEEIYIKSQVITPPDWRLHASRGDTFIWPERYWHVGESPAMSAAINLAVYP